MKSLKNGVSTCDHLDVLDDHNEHHDEHHKVGNRDPGFFSTFQEVFLVQLGGFFSTVRGFCGTVRGLSLVHLGGFFDAFQGIF